MLGEPITVERIEWCLDRVAIAIAKAGDHGSVYLPIYRRLERELAALKEDSTSLSAALHRAVQAVELGSSSRRSGRTAARSSAARRAAI